MIENLVVNEANLTANYVLSSPEYIRTSLASAIALRFKSGRFYRDVKPYCVNLLLTYPDSCFANCAYCGLARTRPANEGDRSFIRVEWPVLQTSKVIERIAKYQQNIRRVCVSMVSHPMAVSDTFNITARLRRVAQSSPVPISVLIAPNLINEEHLLRLKNIGADTVGIGLDTASKRVFERTRGKGVEGPLSWENYWDVLGKAIRIFGLNKVSCHIIVGIGETDKELTEVFFKINKIGALIHLFSFYPEPDSNMSKRRRPSLNRFRRVQLLRHLIETDSIKPDVLKFDASGKNIGIKASNGKIKEVVEGGLPFIIGGCSCKDGDIACNRPFGSYRPGEPFRDFPFYPEPNDITKITKELCLKSLVSY
ncbi:MAG TPA: radical SAM protein [Candidatus Brocadiales bacterium]|nr:radical SAM protein [Candidatus Brocadiales bacterium]